MDRLHLDRLTKLYQHRPVVDALSLRLADGEFCVVLGPSGSGKTTVINMVGGFTPPSAGEIYIGGARASGLPPHRRGIGMVFQSYALFPHLSVFENVAFPLRARGLRATEVKRQVEDALGLVELDELGQRLPRQLSGGQQQRAALARALVFGPKLLLMDEPLAALDRRLRDRMQSELKALQRRLGVTVLYVTHDQQEAMALADTIVVMRQGRAEQIGAPGEVYHRPRTRFVSEFLGESNLLPATVEQADARDMRLRVAGRVIAVARPEGAVIAADQQLTLALRPEKAWLSGADQGEPGAPAHDARVIEATDLGAMRRYRVAYGESAVMLVLEQAAAGLPMRRPGEGVRLCWRAEDAVLLA